MTTQFAYTGLRDYANCPEAYRQITLLKNFKKTFTGDMLNGTDVHDALDKRLKHQTPLPDAVAGAEPFVRSLEQRGEVHAEMMLGVDYCCKPVTFWAGWLRGKFDAVAISGDKAAYVDWKTGKPYENNELQFRIGALLLFQNRPEIETVVGMNVWLKTGQPGQPYTYTRKTASQHWAPLIKQMREIEGRKTDTEWEKTPSALCGWCPVASCQHFKGNQGR